MILLTFLLLLSLGLNVVFFWYIRKLIKNLNIGVDGVDQFQQLLEEYCKNLESVYELEQYYGDETIATAIKNTKMVVEASKFYKKAILDEDSEEENIANNITEQKAG